MAGKNVKAMRDSQRLKKGIKYRQIGAKLTARARTKDAIKASKAIRSKGGTFHGAYAAMKRKMSPAQKAALRKAQLASAKARRGK